MFYRFHTQSSQPALSCTVCTFRKEAGLKRHESKFCDRFALCGGWHTTDVDRLQTSRGIRAPCCDLHVTSSKPGAWALQRVTRGHSSPFGLVMLLVCSGELEVPRNKSQISCLHKFQIRLRTQGLGKLQSQLQTQCRAASCGEHSSCLQLYAFHNCSVDNSVPKVIATLDYLSNGKLESLIIYINAVCRALMTDWLGIVGENHVLGELGSLHSQLALSLIHKTYTQKPCLIVGTFNSSTGEEEAHGPLVLSSKMSGLLDQL